MAYTETRRWKRPSLLLIHSLLVNTNTYTVAVSISSTFLCSFFIQKLFAQLVCTWSLLFWCLKIGGILVKLTIGAAIKLVKLTRVRPSIYLVIKIHYRVLHTLTQTRTHISRTQTYTLKYMYSKEMSPKNKAIFHLISTPCVWLMLFPHCSFRPE